MFRQKVLIPKKLSTNFKFEAFYHKGNATKFKLLYTAENLNKRHRSSHAPTSPNTSYKILTYAFGEVSKWQLLNLYPLAIGRCYSKVDICMTCEQNFVWNFSTTLHLVGHKADRVLFVGVCVCLWGRRWARWA